MTVLVTGAGLIGSETARLLTARGDAVVLFDIRTPADLPAGVDFVAGDITDAAALDALIAERGIGSVVHTAAMLSTGMRADPLRGMAVNLLGTLALLEAARRQGLHRVVCISSTTVLYSGFATLGPDPIPEDAALGLVSQRPGSLYAISKLTGEQLALLYRDLYGVSTVSLRYGAVLGGRTDVPSSVPGRLFATLVAAAGSGQVLKLDDPLLVWAGPEEFIDVRDCAAAAVAALDAALPGLGVYNVTHPRQWRLNDVIAAVAEVHGPLQVEYDRTCRSGFAGFPHRRPAPSDISAAEAELGFTPAHDLRDSLRYWWPATSRNHPGKPESFRK